MPTYPKFNDNGMIAIYPKRIEKLSDSKYRLIMPFDSFQKVVKGGMIMQEDHSMFLVARVQNEFSIHFDSAFIDVLLLQQDQPAPSGEVMVFIPKSKIVYAI